MMGEIQFGGILNRNDNRLFFDSFDCAALVSIGDRFGFDIGRFPKLVGRLGGG